MRILKVGGSESKLKDDAEPQDQKEEVDPPQHAEPNESQTSQKYCVRFSKVTGRWSTFDNILTKIQEHMSQLKNVYLDEQEIAHSQSIQV